MTHTLDHIFRFARIRQHLAYLDVKASYLRCRAMLKAGFNPSQPRVPAGNPDGGQWTSTGGSSGASGRARETVRRDETGTQLWHSVVTRTREDGSIAQETILNRDGSAIRSEFPDSPDEAGFDERHTVMGADGTIVTFQNDGTTQTVFGPDGQVLSANEWTPTGPEPIARVQPAFAPLAGAGVAAAQAAATVRLGLMLYGWYLSRRQGDQQPVVSFQARDFRPAEGEDPTPLQLAWVGNLTREEVDDACPRHVDAQNITNDAAADTNRADYRTPQEYGTAVHLKVRNAVNGPDSRNPVDPNFRSEVSLLKSQEESQVAEDQEVGYGRLGTIRVDVLENTKYNTVCVYDIKTGKSGLSLARFAEISRTVHLRFPDTQRIIVVETRPRQ